MIPDTLAAGSAPVRVATPTISLLFESPANAVKSNENAGGITVVCIAGIRFLTHHLSCSGCIRQEKDKQQNQY